jgi:hypothetical protein
MIQLVTGALLEFPEARKAVIAAVEGAEEERNASLTAITLMR